MLVNSWCTLVLKARRLPCVVISTKEHTVPNFDTPPSRDLELRLHWAYHTNHLITFLYMDHAGMPPFACRDLSLACGRQLPGRFVCGGKHQSAASLWQSSLLTLPADDGKEPQLQVKTSSIACYLVPLSAETEHTQPGLNTVSVATKNVFSPYFCWRVRAVRQKHLSLFSLKLDICRTSLKLSLHILSYCCKSNPWTWIW